MFEDLVRISRKYKAKHPENVKLIDYFEELDNSDAIEIHYKDGKVTVWDENTDLEVTVRDPIM